MSCPAGGAPNGKLQNPSNRSTSVTHPNNIAFWKVKSPTEEAMRVQDINISTKLLSSIFALALLVIAGTIDISLKSIFISLILLICDKVFYTNMTICALTF